MGGFAALLGHAAGGFEQARQQDLQRSFADEQNRRGMAAELLGHIALDPNQPDEVRTPFLNAYMNLAQLPPDKKFDFGKHMAPAFDALSQYRQKVAAAKNAPAPPLQTTVPAMQLGTNTIPATTATVQGPPAPPPGFLAGVPQIAANTGQMASAQSKGTMEGQIAARQQLLSQIPELPPELHAGLALGTPGLYGAMNRTAGTGAGYAKDLRAQGYDVPDNIKDDQYVKVQERVGGQRTFEPAPAPGEQAVGGKLTSGVDVAKQKEQNKQAVDLPYWQKKNAVQFGQRQALLNQAFQLGVDRGYLGDANKAFVDSVKDYGSSLKTMQSMDEAYKSIQANPNNQQAQVALLMSHIGMTLGVVKGARVGKAQIEEAEQSRTAMAGLASRLNFDKNGDLNWSDPIRKGVTLTPDQMQQMVDLGHQRMNILHQNIGVMHDALSPDQMGVQPIGTSFNTPASAPAPKAGGAGKKKLTAPPAPPSSGKKQAYQQDGKWYDAATHQEIH